MDTILHPIMWLISWVMYGIHSALTGIGMHGGAGPAWVLSILGLTITVRLIVLPLYNKQIRASRETQLLQPEIQKIQKKYKGKKDPISQQRQQEELTALYKKHGTSPFSSCLPALVQMPILFALYRVLYAFPQIAAGTKDSLGPITREVAQNFQHSTVFGAPLSASFSDPGSGNQTTVRVVAAVLVLIMSASMFFTQRQLTMKNMPENAMDPNNPAFKTQKYMMYGMPVIYLFSGVAFQIGVLVYWVFGNLWTIGQQSWFIRTNPTPGSRAYREREARIRRKRLRQGMTDEEIDALEAEEKHGGQRQQPLGKARSKKMARKNLDLSIPNAEDDSSGAGQEEAASAVETEEVRGKDGLTDAERARRRYERRQAERARSRAKAKARQKKAQQNKKQRNF